MYPHCAVLLIKPKRGFVRPAQMLPVDVMCSASLWHVVEILTGGHRGCCHEPPIAAWPRCHRSSAVLNLTPRTPKEDFLQITNTNCETNVESSKLLHRPPQTLLAAVTRVGCSEVSLFDASLLILIQKELGQPFHKMQRWAHLAAPRREISTRLSTNRDREAPFLAEQREITPRCFPLITVAENPLISTNVWLEWRQRLFWVWMTF